MTKQDLRCLYCPINPKKTLSCWRDLNEYLVGLCYSSSACDYCEFTEIFTTAMCELHVVCNRAWTQNYLGQLIKTNKIII